MIIDKCRDIEELRRLYNERPMPFQYDFDWLVNNPCLFCLYGEKGLLGFVTVQRENGVLTLSGTSVRKNLKGALFIINRVCECFDEDMYSITPLREAGVLLRKAGFERVDNITYRRIKNG
jgi:hypothetical protein